MARGQLFFRSPPALPAFLLRVSAHFGRTASPSTRPVDQTWGTSIFHHRNDTFICSVWKLIISRIWPWHEAWLWLEVALMLLSQFRHNMCASLRKSTAYILSQCSYSGALMQNPELPTVINPPKRILLGFQPGHVVEAQLIHGTCEIRTGKETTQDSWWGVGRHIRFMMIDGYQYPHM